PETRVHLRRLQWEGYEVTALDSTTDFSIPAIIVVVRHRSRRTVPYAMCVGGSHYKPAQALRKALRELIPGLRRYGIELRDKDKLRKAQQLADDPSSVQTMEDHAFLYCVAEASSALDFLTSGSRYTSIEEMESTISHLWSNDLTEELLGLAGRIFRTGH